MLYVCVCVCVTVCLLAVTDVLFNVSTLNLKGAGSQSADARKALPSVKEAVGENDQTPKRKEAEGGGNLSPEELAEKLKNLTVNQAHANNSITAIRVTGAERRGSGDHEEPGVLPIGPVEVLQSGSTPLGGGGTSTLKQGTMFGQSLLAGDEEYEAERLRKARERAMLAPGLSNQPDNDDMDLDLVLEELGHTKLGRTPSPRPRVFSQSVYRRASVSPTQSIQSHVSDAYSEDEAGPLPVVHQAGVTGRPPRPLTNEFEEWFHGVITRREAETMLKGTEAGTFIVRQKWPGLFYVKF